MPMSTKEKQARVIPLETLPNVKWPLPQSWKRAAGILRGKRAEAMRRHLKTIRAEWGGYYGRQRKIAARKRRTPAV